MLFKKNKERKQINVGDEGDKINTGALLAGT